MKEEFIIERDGKSFVLYAGLLDAAHGQGLQAIETTLLQAPTTENDQVAIVAATVRLVDQDGTVRSFAGLGDASPANVTRLMVPHLIRMGETRAKARALRDAVNVGVAVLEEWGSDAGEEDEVRPRPAATARAATTPTRPAKPAATPATGAPAAAAGAAPARPNGQAAAIAASDLLRQYRELAGKCRATGIGDKEIHELGGRLTAEQLRPEITRLEDLLAAV